MLSDLVQPTAVFQLPQDPVVHPGFKKFHPYYKIDKQYNQTYSIYNQKANSNNSYTLMEGMGNAMNNYRRPAGYSPDQNYLAFLSDKSVRFMSNMITKYLKNVHPEGKNIIVPDTTIRSVADSIYTNDVNDVSTMQTMCVSLIVTKIREEFDQFTTNNKLSAWVQNYDGTNGIKQFNDAKLNNLGVRGNWTSTMQWRY